MQIPGKEKIDGVGGETRLFQREIQRAPSDLPLRLFPRLLTEKVPLVMKVEGRAERTAPLFPPDDGRIGQEDGRLGKRKIFLHRTPPLPEKKRNEIIDHAVECPRENPEQDDGSRHRKDF